MLCMMYIALENESASAPVAENTEDKYSWVGFRTSMASRYIFKTPVENPGMLENTIKSLQPCFFQRRGSVVSLCATLDFFRRGEAVQNSNRTG